MAVEPFTFASNLVTPAHYQPFAFASNFTPAYEEPYPFASKLTASAYDEPYRFASNLSFPAYDPPYVELTEVHLVEIMVRRSKDTTIPPDVIGWTSTFGVYSLWACSAGKRYIVVSGYARCVPDNQDDYAIYKTCLAGGVIANEMLRSTCTGDGYERACVTGTVYESRGDVHPTYYVGCWPSWRGGNWKATRTVSASTKATETSATKYDDGRSSVEKPAPGSAPIIALVVGSTFGSVCSIALAVFLSRWCSLRRGEAALEHGYLLRVPRATENTSFSVMTSVLGQGPTTETVDAKEIVENGVIYTPTDWAQACVSVPMPVALQGCATY